MRKAVAHGGLGLGCLLAGLGGSFAARAGVARRRHLVPSRLEYRDGTLPDRTVELDEAEVASHYPPEVSFLGEQSPPGWLGGDTPPDADHPDESDHPDPVDPNLVQQESSAGLGNWGRNGRGKDSPDIDYVGCVNDDGNRDFAVLMPGRSNSAQCSKLCKAYPYFALQAGGSEPGECWCDSTYATGPTPDRYNIRNTFECAPAPWLMKRCGDGPCGMGWRNAVYSHKQENPVQKALAGENIVTPTTKVEITSQYAHYAASLMVDGNRYSKFLTATDPPSCTHFAQPSGKSVATLNVGDVQQITGVRIYVRGDCCAERNNNIKVAVSDGTIEPIDCPGQTSVVQGGVGQWDCPVKTNGNIITISSDEKNLSLCEVEIYAEEALLKGPQGPQGPKGDRGEPGAPGDAGETGQKGAQGPEGPVGGAGAVGDSGQDGEPGKQGDVGRLGDQGAEGLLGDAGLKGEPGMPGKVGKEGDSGPKGEIGENGDVGFPGNPGTNGDQGEEGPKGPPGIDGGKGPKGGAGNVGPEGPLGPQGDKGVKGAKGVRGTDGKGAKGGPGKKGNRGPPGAMLPPGETKALDGLVAAVDKLSADIKFEMEEWDAHIGQGTQKQVQDALADILTKQSHLIDGLMTKGAEILPDESDSFARE